jgi:DNA repair and recombination protein RAD52
VTLKNGAFQEDIGHGKCENKSKATAIENPKKEAVSDARKRALRAFGNALGNTVYDKDYLSSIRIPTKKVLFFAIFL